MRQTLRDEFWNLPNILTLARIAAIPFVMLLIWRGAPKDCVLAAWAYSLAAATDYVDGWLARRWNQETLMGRLLDPLADKLMVMGMLIMMVTLMRVPGWLGGDHSCERDDRQWSAVSGFDRTVGGAFGPLGKEENSTSDDRRHVSSRPLSIPCLLLGFPYRGR